MHLKQASFLSRQGGDLKLNESPHFHEIIILVIIITNHNECQAKKSDGIMTTFLLKFAENKEKSRNANNTKKIL